MSQKAKRLADWLLSAALVAGMTGFVLFYLFDVEW